jgi:hypothetical protein
MAKASLLKDLLNGVESLTKGKIEKMKHSSEHKS